MWMVKCLLLVVASVVFAWDPVRPGALVKKVGNMMIVNQSVRILLSFENVTHVRDTLITVQDGIKIVKDRLGNGISHKRLLNKLKVVENKFTSLETNFVHTKRDKRSISIGAAIGTRAGLGITNIALYAEMRSTVNTLQESLPKLNNPKENVDDIQATIIDISANLEQLSLNQSTLQGSLDILLIDQMYLKLLEIHSDMETFRIWYWLTLAMLLPHYYQYLS